jgi:hypothetical protein
MSEVLISIACKKRKKNQIVAQLVYFNLDLKITLRGAGGIMV